MSSIDNTTSSPTDLTGVCISVLITKHDATLQSRLSQISVGSIDLVIVGVRVDLVAMNKDPQWFGIIGVEIGLEIPKGPHYKQG